MKRPALTLALLFVGGGATGQEAPFPRVEIGGEVIGASVATAKVRLRLSLRPNPDAEGSEVPALEVLWDGESISEILATSAVAEFPATAGLVEMDPANDTPEVFFETYTGGAHCCTELRIITRSASGKWKVLDAGGFNGGGGLVSDVDGDGRYEIVASNEEFLYAFGCYACSAAPLEVSAIESGDLRDVTFEPRFHEKHREYLQQLEKGLDLSQVQNGFLAGWVAQKIIVGEGKEAWADMLTAYDKEDDWGLLFCPDGTTECADEHRVLRPFPDVLKDFLIERGYPL
jgi:hypothetical protein